MELSDIIIIILLISCLSMWFSVLSKKDNCPPQTVIIKECKPLPELDLQFDKQNFPSTVYENVFLKPNIYQGGYNIDQGRNINQRS